jgi:hypothetical protein
MRGENQLSELSKSKGKKYMIPNQSGSPGARTKAEWVAPEGRRRMRIEVVDLRSFGPVAIEFINRVNIASTYAKAIKGGTRRRGEV